MNRCRTPWADAIANRTGRSARTSVASKRQDGRAQDVKAEVPGTGECVANVPAPCGSGSDFVRDFYIGTTASTRSCKYPRAQFWRISRLRAPTRMRPASVTPRVSRQSTSARAGRVQTWQSDRPLARCRTSRRSPIRSRDARRRLMNAIATRPGGIGCFRSHPPPDGQRWSPSPQAARDPRVTSSFGQAIFLLVMRG
jgi:hypothetical protein